jgi:hypothetical protein
VYQIADAPERMANRSLRSATIARSLATRSGVSTSPSLTSISKELFGVKRKYVNI